MEVMSVTTIEMQINEGKLIRVILWVSALALIVPLLMYWFRTKLPIVSELTSDWVNFSIYWSAFIYLVNTLIIAGLTYLLFQYNKQRDLEIKRREEILDRPVIVFRKYTNRDYYTLSNVGKGAALNLRIKTFHYSDQSNVDWKGKQNWSFACEGYALGTGEDKEMKWTWSCIAIGAEYTDVWGNQYYSYMDGDKLRTFTNTPSDRKHYKKEADMICKDTDETHHFSWLNEQAKPNNPSINFL